MERHVRARVPQRLRGVVALAGLVLAAGCGGATLRDTGSQGEAGDGDATGAPTGGDPSTSDATGGTDAPPFSEAEIVHCDGTEPTAPVTITSAALIGDVLRVDIEYQDCATNHFGLCTSGFVVDETPGRTDAWIVHRSTGDDCRPASTSLEFAMRPLFSIVGYEPWSIIEVDLRGWGIFHYPAINDYCGRFGRYDCDPWYCSKAYGTRFDFMTGCWLSQQFAVCRAKPEDDADCTGPNSHFLSSTGKCWNLGEYCGAPPARWERVEACASNEALSCSDRDPWP